MSLASDETLPSTGFPPQAVRDDYFSTDHLLKDLPARSFRSGVVTVTGQAANFFLQMGATAVLARLLTPQDYGLIAMVGTIIGFVGLFKDLGLSDATVQRADITHSQISFLFWVNFGLSVLVALVVTSIAPLVAWFYREPRLVGITLLLSLNFILGGLTVQHQALMRRRMQFKTLTAINTVATASGFIAGILFALLGWRYWALVGIQLVSMAAYCFLIWAKCHWRPSVLKRGVGARPLLAFGRNLTAYHILNYFTLNFDNALIGRVLGPKPLGFYSKAYGLLLVPATQVNAPITAVLLPGLSRLQNKTKEYLELFLNATRSVALVSVPIVVFSFFFAGDVILLLLGERWLQVAPLFQWLGPAALMEGISFAPHWLCQSLGRTNRQLHFAFVSAPIAVTGFLIGIRWGTIGVAASFSLTMLLTVWWFAWYASRDTPVSFGDILKNFLAAFVPAVVAGAVSFLLRHRFVSQDSPGVALVAFGSMFWLIYAALIMVSPRSRALIAAAVRNCTNAFRS